MPGTDNLLFQNQVVHDSVSPSLSCKLRSHEFSEQVLHTLLDSNQQPSDLKSDALPLR